MSVKVVTAHGETKKSAYRLRYDVMCKELEWLSPDNYSDCLEKDEYDDIQSMSFVALDHSGTCVGTSRLIFPGEIPLPIEKHFTLYPKEFIEAVHGAMRHCVEVSRFVVPDNEQLKRHEITLMLCRAMIQASIRMRVSHMLMSADYRFFRLLRILGFRLEEIGEAKFFMGSKTVPGILPIENLLDELKQKKPALYEYITAEAGSAEEKPVG